MMELSALMLCLLMVPIHAYVLQPSARVTAVEDSERDGVTWSEGGKENAKEPLPAALDLDLHWEGDTEDERGGVLEREVRQGENVDDQAGDEEPKMHERGHRGDEMEEYRSLDEEKEEQERVKDEEQEGERGADSEEAGKEGMDRDRGKEEDTDDSEEVLTGKDMAHMEYEMDAVENTDQQDYIVAGGEEMLITSRPSITTDATYLSIAPGLSMETDSRLPNSTPVLSIDTEITHLNPTPAPSVHADNTHFYPISALLLDSDITHLNPTPAPSMHADFTHLNPIPALPLDTGISHLNPNPAPSMHADFTHLNPIPALSLDTGISHLNLTPAPSMHADFNHLNPIPAVSLDADITHLNPTPALFTHADVTHLNTTPALVSGTDITHLNPNLALPINVDILHFNSTPGLSTVTNIPLSSPTPDVSMDSKSSLLSFPSVLAIDTPLIDSNPAHSTEKHVSNLNPNFSSHKVTDSAHFSPTPGPSSEKDASHLSHNPHISTETESSHSNPRTEKSFEIGTSTLSPHPDFFTAIDPTPLNPTPSPTLYIDQNSSVSNQELNPFQNILHTADSTVSPTAGWGPVTAGDSDEARMIFVTPHSEHAHLWNLTGSSRPYLTGEEGLGPKVTEMKVGSSMDLTDTDSVTEEQKSSERNGSKFNRLTEKTKSKKSRLAKKTETARGRHQNKANAAEKSKSPKKDKARKNKKKLQRENGKAEIVPSVFPYFHDDYCPPECACYGRVTQCSDKGLDKIPYGIPYNSRYLLLMNNQITGIELDLLREYASLEFLVLSNNLLTDGGVEGAFEGTKQLKRLYLDRNQLNSVPTDLPLSLEELRMDANNVSIMSEVAWAHRPYLQILSLNNNSLGSESVPDGVFIPLTSLRTLSLIHNFLATVPVRLPTNIKDLYLRGNHIDRVPGNTFLEGSDLLVLDLSANQLTNKGLTKDSFRALVHLENLNLEGNLLRNVPQYLPSTLRTLNLEGNAIASVGKAAFLGLPHLEHLGLACNKIARVATGAFWGLSALHQLELGYNALRQVPRRLPPTLHSVSLVHNKINSVPRDSFCTKGMDSALSSLVTVHLEHNLLQLANLDTQAFNCLRGYQVIHLY